MTLLDDMLALLPDNTAGDISALDIRTIVTDLYNQSLAVQAAGQPLDSDLTAIAALVPANDDVVQRKAGAWTNRTIAQLKTDLGPSADLPQTTQPAPVSATARVYALDDNSFTGLHMADPAGFDADLLHDMWLVVRNTTGSTITKGTPVYFVDIFPGGGIVPLVAPAKADAIGTMPCIGLMQADTANNSYGRLIHHGDLVGLNTSGFGLNDRLYVSAASAGQLTNVRPAHPNYTEVVAFVERVHATTGVVHVTIRAALGDELGTRSATWGIGSNTGGGANSIQFKNGNSLTLQATPTATRTITLPDATGTVALTASPTFTGTVTQAAVTQTGRTLTTYTVLTDAATIAVDASLGNHFTVTLGGNRTLGNPTNPPGAGQDQMILFAIRQDGTGSRTLTLDTNYRFGTDITSITLSTGINKTDYLGVRYNVTDSKWDVIAFVKGY